MKNVKLLICYHKPAQLYKDDVLTPIHVGRAKALKNNKRNEQLNWMLDNMIGDDTGQNISLKNGTYNELTSLFWAWKNYDKIDNPEYIGLMHYRRHFIFNESEVRVQNIKNVDAHYLEYLNYSPEKLSNLLEDCDFACHLGKVDNIYKHYLINHRKEDIDLALNILKEKYPKLSNVADEYMNQDVGNFCNMFIFPKKIFFEYCEFIFSILEEFEKRVDVTNKRFFISERLTGIFIYNLMKKGYKYKSLPITFVEEPIKIPIAIPLDQDKLFQLVVSIMSITKNLKRNTSCIFYLISDKDVDDAIKKKILNLKKLNSNIEFEFIKSTVNEEYYPLELSKLLPQYNKIIFLKSNVTVIKDLAEFFITCSVDDYYINGLPLEKYEYNIHSVDKKIKDDLLVINCAKFRRDNIFDKALNRIKNVDSGCEILNELCYNQINYIPHWFITNVDELSNDKIAGFQKSRAQLQQEANWTTMIYYGERLPWIDSQSVYSIFWWNYAKYVPISFDFIDIREESVREIYSYQQQQINRLRSNKNKCIKAKIKKLISKTLKYYKKNGVKKTIIKSCKKIRKKLRYA